MYAIYSFQDLTYHHHFGLIKKGFPDPESAEAFIKELYELNRDVHSEYISELVVCKELKTHTNEEYLDMFYDEETAEAYNELVNKYFGDTQ